MKRLVIHVKTGRDFAVSWSHEHLQMATNGMYYVVDGLRMNNCMSIPENLMVRLANFHVLSFRVLMHYDATIWCDNYGYTRFIANLSAYH